MKKAPNMNQAPAQLYRRHGRIFLSVVLFALFACGSPQDKQTRGNKHGIEQQNQVGNAGYNPQEISYFSIFNPTIDINVNDNFPASYMAQRFPLHYQDSQASFIPNGLSLYQARIDLLEQAQRSVRIQVFIFKADETGYLVGQKLIELANRGIKVQVLVDPVINYSPKDRIFYAYLRKNGVDIRGFDVAYMDFISGAKNQSEQQQLILNANRRFHEKLFLIDSELGPNAQGIVGGVNISNEYFDVEQETPIKMWRDRDILVRGTIVQDMTQAFDRTYAEATRLLHSDPSSFKNLISNITESLVEFDINKLELRPHVLQKLTAGINFQPMWHPGQMRFLQSSPRNGEDFIFPAYLSMIREAKSEILINNAYLLPEEPLIAALIEAVQRGVQVKIITNHQEITDIPQQNLVGRSRYKFMMAVNQQTNINGAKLEIYEWGGHKNLGNGLGLNHAKYAIFDRKAVIIGSYNLDPRSHTLNSECVLAITNSVVLEDFLAEFHEELSPNLVLPITWEQALSFAQPDGLGANLKLKFATLFANFL